VAVVSLKMLLESWGFKTENGHELSCICEECLAARRRREVEIRERIRDGKEPETLIEILVEARRKKKETT
jgi:hypothetical protein